MSDRETIIRLAREAGASQLENTPGFVDYLERFAALVAAAEREACVELCLQQASPLHHADRLYNNGTIACATAIRARSTS